MAELIEIGEQQERVILFAASTNDSDDTEESVEELKELVKTAGAETVGTVIQNRENIHPGTYLGKGKIQELKEMVWRATQELCKMLPYVVTIIVLVITSKRNKLENQPPASLGEAYFREDR